MQAWWQGTARIVQRESEVRIDGSSKSTGSGTKGGWFAGFQGEGKLGDGALVLPCSACRFPNCILAASDSWEDVGFPRGGVCSPSEHAQKSRYVPVVYVSGRS